MIENNNKDINNQNDNIKDNIKGPHFQRSFSGTYGQGEDKDFEYENSEYKKKQEKQFFTVEDFKHRNDIWRLGNAVGLAAVLFFVGNFVLQWLFSKLAIIIAGEGWLYKWACEPNNLYIISGICNILVLTVPYFIMQKITGIRLSDVISFKISAKSNAIPIIMLGIGVSAISDVGSSYFNSVLKSLFNITVKSSAPPYSMGLKSFLLMFLLVGILPAVLEEFAMRGAVLGTVRKYFEESTAILISSVIFAMLHGNLYQIPFAFVMGIVLAYATVYTGSIIPAMVTHCLVNTGSVVMYFATSVMSPLFSNLVSLLYLLVRLLIGICGFVMLVKADVNALRLKDCGERLSKDVFLFFTSPWIIVFILLTIYQIISVQF